MSKLQTLEGEGGYFKPVSFGELCRTREDLGWFIPSYPDGTVNLDHHRTGKPLDYCLVNPQGHIEFITEGDIFAHYAQKDAEEITHDPGYMLDHPINLRAFDLVEFTQLLEITNYYKWRAEGALGDRKIALNRLLRMFTQLKFFLFEKQDGGFMKSYFNGHCIRDFVQVETGVNVGWNLEVHLGDVFSLPKTDHWSFEV